MSYATPRADEQGRRMRTLLGAYRRAGGADAALLLHSREAGARLISELGRLARTDAAVHGVPARVLPLEVWHTAAWASSCGFRRSRRARRRCGC